MHRLAVLAKIQLLDFFSKYKSGMGLRAPRARIFLYLTLVILAFPFIQMSVGAYQTFLLQGRPEGAVALMYLTVVLFMSFTAIPFLLSHFFSLEIFIFASSPPHLLFSQTKHATVIC